MIKKLFTLVLCLVLTGCAAPPLGETDSPPVPDPEPALTIGEENVPVWAYRYWLRLACEQTQAIYQEAGQTPNWTADGPGSLQEQVRSQAAADAALWATVDVWARDWGLTLTQEDQSQLDALWQQRSKDYGGEAAYLTSLAERGLTAEQARALAETGQRYRKLHQAALDSANPNAPDDDALSAFAEEQGLLAFDQIRTEGEDARHRIELLFSQLNAAQEPQSIFSALTAEGVDHQGPRSCQCGDGTLTAPLEDAVRALKPGQHSGILEAGEGYAILLRLPPDRSALVPAWLDAQLLEASRAVPVTLLPAISSIPIPVGM